MQETFLFKRMQRKKNVGPVVLLAILTFLMIGGSLFILVLRNGLKGMEKRLGADVMVVPAGCEKTAESVLLEGSREYFYFEQLVADNIRSVNGIEKLTEQFYLSSLVADCCSSQVGIVGFDPKTDFIIQPWIDEKDKGQIGTGKAIVGSDIEVGEDRVITLFGREYPVISILASTGTSMDTSVYFTMDTVPQLIEDAENKGIQFLDSQKNENTISSIFITLQSGVTEREIARRINEIVDADVDILYPDSILSTFAQSTNHMVSVTYITLLVVWLVVEFILLIVCYISSNGRKKEYALFRVLGLSKKQLIVMVVNEGMLISLIGFVLGGALSGITVFPFGRYLANVLGIAYLTPTVLETITILAIGLVLTVLSDIIASIIPIVKICKIEAYSALREEE